MKNRILLILIFTVSTVWIYGNTLKDTSFIENASLRLNWQKSKDGWRIQALSIKSGNAWIPIPGVSGEYTILYSKGRPDSANRQYYDNKGHIFPDTPYKYQKGPWKEATHPVGMNTAGEATSFYPASLRKAADGSISFTHNTKEAILKSSWKADPAYSGDIQVKMVLTAKSAGYFSLASPSLVTVRESDLAWGVIPGILQGSAIEHDFVKAFAYGQGIPDLPVMVRERTVSTLSPVISLKNGISISVIPDPGTGRDPWKYDKLTQDDWHLGLSLMNRKARLTPTAYHPVLAQRGSYLAKGDSVVFSFRYSVREGDWYQVYRHAVYDVYKLNNYLSLKQTKQSLTDRILAMRKYTVDDKTSKWITEEYKGLTIGAQAYLGGVYNSAGDAMKNSDYGAMWMLAKIMNDSVLKRTRLPYAMNFKKVQQQQEPGFYEGAAVGQYYLTKSKRFTEEWGNYVEPIALTYYIMMDLGNILLFDPSQKQLKEELRKGADKLLEWMSPGGKWQVAYDRTTEKPLFTDIEDLRPTFYGLVIAYRMLGDKKYLDAARTGANWYIKNAVNKGAFLGVCGDARFAPDFATGQSAQALSDLYDITRDQAYKQAAIEAARFYTTSVYTHPIPTEAVKKVKDVPWRDADLSQVGLSFEHGGILGSANKAGPILLASHAGLFVRMFALTGDSIYIHMARAAALGRDAFIDPATTVASYYWNAMNRGPGSFPHHAWWQIGWITDYLLSEADLRSEGKISFPRGFITPKVGPHQPYGFEPGRIFGTSCDLFLRDGMITPASPYIDYITAISESNKKIFVVLLNNDDESISTPVKADLSKIQDRSYRIKGIRLLNNKGNVELPETKAENMVVNIPPYQLKVLEISYE